MLEKSLIPGKLKLELFCKGARVGKNCRLEDDTRPIKRTRGGLGSGLDVILPGNVWVNIPITEPFASESPYWIDKTDSIYSLWYEVKKICNLTLPPKPDWYDNLTSSGKRIGDIGVMQGTYFAVYPSELCGFWQTEPKANCRFCSIGICHGKTESEEKSVHDVVEAVKAAREHEHITFVHFNTGFYDNDRALDVILPYVKAVKKETGLLVGVQCPPAIELKKYDVLKSAGVNHVSFCFEIFGPDKFVEICPGKAESFGKAAEELSNDPLILEVKNMARAFLDGNAPHPGQLIFYRALLHCARLWGKGPVAGEIIAGLESPESSIAATKFLGQIGAVTTVCVFRPCIGTGLETEAVPASEQLSPVFAQMYETCLEQGIPFGVAPGISTAMVHLQGEGKCFSSNAKGELFHKLKCILMSAVFRTLCALKRLGKR